MTYEEGMRKALQMEWKTTVCNQGEKCWCRGIQLVEPLLDDDGNDIHIAVTGTLDRKHAEYIVKLHNEYIKQNQMSETSKQMEKLSILERYQNLIEQTAVYPRKIGIAYASLGLAGEAGEIANKVKKMYRDQGLLDLDTRTPDGNYISKEYFIQTNKDAVKAELGDVLWYVTALAKEFDLTLEEVMEYNIEKLTSRKERGTLQGSGDNR